jgi:hypothetical protein
MAEVEKRGKQARRRPRQTFQAAESIVEREIPENRAEEIRRYLELFGYKPESSILQVYVSGFFGRTRPPEREMKAREEAARRYGGRTFTVVGRTHDPAILDNVIQPRKKPESANPGYVGYLWKDKDKEGKPPHELLPKDFTPAKLNYPKNWKDVFATRGFLITMHVPSSFAAKKNSLNRTIYRLKGRVDVKEPWGFIDDLEGLGAKNELWEREEKKIIF